MNTKVDEGKLISGKEALIAWYEGLEIEVKHNSTGWFVFTDHNFGITVFKSEDHQFRLKPRTISINGIEVPAPFEPKEGEWFYFIKADSENGYSSRKLHDDTPKYLTLLGAWRTEEEIKQVVATLRQVFGGSHDN